MTDEPTGPGKDPIPEAQETAGMPRWVKMSLIAVGILIAGLIVASLLGHQLGPGMHFGLGTNALSSVDVRSPSDLSQRTDGGGTF